MPTSPIRSQTSVIDLITKILDAKTDKDPGSYSRYDHLWSTIDPSLGDRFLVPCGDVDALSCALVQFSHETRTQDRSSLKSIQDSICKEHGLLIPSVECRDAGGFVWIGFRGVSFPSHSEDRGC